MYMPKFQGKKKILFTSRKQPYKLTWYIKHIHSDSMLCNFLKLCHCIGQQNEQKASQKLLETLVSLT